MKIQELRVGNWYLSTKFQTPVKCEVADFWEIYSRADGSTPDEREVDQLFQPLPLTPEWFEKFEFRMEKPINQLTSDEVLSPWIMLNFPDRHMDFVEGSEGYWYPQLVQEPEVSSEDIHAFPCNRIKYVHELQNLFFVIQGEELEIK